ncbi:MAG: DUF6089 family protein [Bacteroidales bacterium]|nr:DUF6089 family protein [Bacteroidales bacterium]
MIKRILFIALMLFSGVIYGQYLEIGPYMGGSYYIGDLNPNKHFSMMSPAYGGIVRCNFTTRWVGRINFMYGNVSGDDQKTRAVENRDLNFESRIFEISMQGEVNFLPYLTGDSKYFFSPYIFGGVGIFTMNPTGVINGERLTLRELGTEGQLSGKHPDLEPYALTHVCIPFGIGFRVSFWNNFCVGIEWGIRKTFTDYLDDCSTVYYLDNETADFSVMAQLASDPTMNHKAGMQRGTSETNDWYAFVGFTLTYKVNLYRSSDCNKFSSPDRGFK